MSQQDTKTTEEMPRIFLRENVTILIAEDDRGHYRLTQSCLREASIKNEIIWFEDGQATLDFLDKPENREKEKRFLMLLDVRMPKVDGLEVLQKIKKDPKLEDIIVIMLTTSDDQDLAHQCYALGCEAHIVKPPGRVLLKAIERVSRYL